MLLRLRNLKLSPTHLQTLPFLVSTKILNPKPFSSSEPHSDAGPPEWTDEILYLDESGGVIGSGRGLRPTEPGRDDHILAGGLRRPLPRSAAVSKLVELACRWRWGPDLDAHLDRLPFPPDPSLLYSALAALPAADPEPSLSLFRWARRQPWFSASDATYSLLLHRLAASSDLDAVLSLFDDILTAATFSGSELSPASFSSSLNLAIQYLCRASKLEVAFCCFKKLRDLGFKGVTTQTYNSLITLFLSKGLPYKAFEIYESMEVSGCSLDASTYDLMVPSLARSGRLDAALRLFEEMKTRDGGGRPGFSIYLALVDSMGKAGRLDAAIGVYREMQMAGYKPSIMMYVSMIESLVKAGKLDAGVKIWDEMKAAGFRPNFGLYTMMVEAQARSGRLEAAAALFGDMEKAGFLPSPSTYACLIEMQSAAGQVDPAMRLYNSMSNAGLRPGLSTFTLLLTVVAKRKLLDLAAKILLEMKSVGFSVDVNASDVLMIYIKDGSTDLALRWLRFMGSAGIRTNNFIIRQLFESCMKAGLYESARPLVETYVGSAAKVDLILYTSILAHLVRCQDEKNERAIMDIMSATKHTAHEFMSGLFTGPEQRGKPVLLFVREFFQGIDYEVEESAARYFVNVLLNYLVLMGQMNRARCVWKVAYENKLFPKAIVFDQHIAWSLDVRNLSVGAALVAVVHTLHRFRKRMLYYGVVPRRIKLVTGSTLKMVVAQMLESVESPFEVSKVVLRAPGDSVLEWFKKPIVQQFLLNEIPSKADVLMHKLNVLFPCSVPEARSLSPSKALAMSRNLAALSEDQP
ncbi:pentatricopeptide repeat-containing protein At1g79490, mitochondrial isoform X2 [Phoenix dactylifera]|uniref:Pentatricopeptide repeat-containing protein At1g79490, mitochondrial isoform X2 n=1 Tax=Phoenix dactylifera TaxID=42345 RepID=A0A8B9A9D6_PHODC|nr:pentatricopeptide repeat-containing protein At1g79490, mitochondrial-like isoform X2 [Phoenix dactylifera]XP_038980508.1 pentatricopeptide repeat-containing protein At1g79490, mitochondrial isoform X2 [Phoenix dactylifera]